MKRGFTPASKAQREKVAGATFCPKCGRSLPLDPAHVTARARGGCDDPDCVIGLCRDCHRLYDQGGGDVLSILTKAEQAHAVSHSGVLQMLHQTTGVRWAPERAA